ncbi:MAG: polymer-forming cytoskeletal protein [Thermoanaerobaculales bacterium]|jgi:cytoskeletal protein CcmA (bactofilin family)|nr:polymer-forming cytoskeletal protein [Thermoanaerobaculales bacterium]
MGIFGRDEANPDQRAAQSTITPSASPATPEAPDRTVIARPSKIEGRISGSGEIVVNGLVTGTIEASGTVKVAEQGRVEATIHGKIVTIAGTVTGDVTANEKIELETSAHVDGNITAPRILIRDGATFKGQVNMKEPERRPSVRTSSARKESSDPPG